MGSRTLKKVLLIVLLVIVVCICCIDFKSNLEQIKIGYSVNQIPKENEFIDGKEAGSGEGQKDNKVKNSTSFWKVIERKDNYNNELQFYSKDNVDINGTTIEITSKKETKEDKMFTSGLVESTSAYKYGYFEFTIMISEGKGIFPAIWFLPNEGGPLPEIDLFEMIGNKPNIFYGVIHFLENDVQDFDYFSYEVPKKDKYSVALEWQADALTWYIDHQEIYTTTKGVPQEFMYILINQAVGGDWPGNPDENTIFPNQFKVISKRIEPVFYKGRD